jgi:SAM-dependent methyltransferase
VSETPVESAYDYFARPDVVDEYATLEFLLEPERRIFDEIARSRIEGARILDVGVGAGRTTRHLAPLAREYLGVDSSARMIEACRKRFSGRSDQRVSFRVGDVRAMDFLEPASFDFVLFSFNGLDVAGDHGDRLRALSEMNRVCAAGGTLCFSSHNLAFVDAGFSVREALRQLVASRPTRKEKILLLGRPRLVLGTVARPLRWRRLNQSRRALAGVGHASIVEERPRYEFSPRFYASPKERIRVRKYYIRPLEQIRQLRQLGFDDIRVLTPEGIELTEPAQLGRVRSWWLYYLCVKKREASRSR